MNPRLAGLIAVAWMAWVLPFFLIRRGNRGGATIDRRARWGIVIEGVAFALIWQTSFWTHDPGALRTAGAAVFLALASLLSWTSAVVLGRQWRFDAGLNADHQLVTGGAYRVVRHPIYTSMLCLLIGMGLIVSPFLLLLAAVAVFMAGTEIRVRIEDGLLAARFGQTFLDYRRRVAAYVPFVW